MLEPRPTCLRCRKAAVTCYCAELRPYAPWPRFVILMHRDEARRSVATGRMAHLSLSNSLLFEGTDFSEHDGVNGLLADGRYAPVILYPGVGATPVEELFPTVPSTMAEKQPLIFVLDGTWRTVRRIWRFSRNLHGLPAMKLRPDRPSGFIVRRQPRPECLSTIEAIHAVLDRFWLREPSPDRPHDNLLAVFDSMVRAQLSYCSRIQTRTRAHRGTRRREPAVPG